MLTFAFLFTVYSIVSCFQIAAGILAVCSGKNFWTWFWISLFLPLISMIILVALWDEEKLKDHRKAW